MLNGRRRIFFAILVLSLLSPEAFARRFRNAYVSFELPPNWSCRLEGADWVCENNFSKKQKEAIIILTAKEKGPSDSLASYRAHLKTPRIIPGKNGKPGKSQVLHVKDRLIANQPWVDGMHLGSEVGPYFTRYLATIKDRIAILVTFSAHKEHFTKYSEDFRKAIESLRVVASKDLLADRRDSGRARSSNETIGAPIGANIPMIDSGNVPPESSSGQTSKSKLLLILAIILGAVGAYVYLKSKKKKKAPTNKKKKK